MFGVKFWIATSKAWKWTFKLWKCHKRGKEGDV